ncbi:MAG: hypothetical protein COB93_01210 [Sneathiella sp.]|nr:MAG: hypothetical protein COB93_01210 [Sneathiella sp.]
MPCLTDHSAKRKRCAALHWAARFVVPVALSVAVLVSAGSAHAETNEKCLASWKKPSIDIKRITAKPTINHKKNSRQIEAVAKKSNFVKAKGYKRLLGLNNVSLAQNISVSTSHSKAKDGRYCIRLEKVSFDFGIRKTEIYIDRKYRKSTCAYKVTLEHENEHTRLNQKTVDEYRPRIKKDLKKSVVQIKPFLTRDPNFAIQSIISRISFDMKPLLEEFSAARQAANDVIDTKQSYLATHRKCNDW